MKIKLLIVSIAMLLAGQISAQTLALRQEKKVSVSMGVVGGLDLSTISTSYPISADFGLRPGFNAGVAANFRFLKRNARSTAKTGLLAIQPEIRYATLGANSKESDLGLGYVMVPIMFQVYPTKNLYVEVGPELALNISHTPDNIAISSHQLNFKNFKPNDIMLAAGVGFMINGLNIGARYNLGFSKMASNLPWKNSLIQVNIGYFFSKKKTVNRIIINQ